MNYKLRQLAETIGPDAGRFKRLANSVEEFTFRLLDPLKTDSGWCKQFGDYSLDEMLNDAIEFEQKKVGKKAKCVLLCCSNLHLICSYP